MHLITNVRSPDLLYEQTWKPPKADYFIQEDYQHTEQPNFSVSDELILRNFHFVFKNGFDDHALLSTIMLTFSFPASEYESSHSFLEYQSQAMRLICQRMSFPEETATEPTLGAILLLARIEVCTCLSIRFLSNEYDSKTCLNL